MIFGHTIADRSDVAFFNLLDNFNVGFTLLAIYLCSFVAIFAVAFLINGLSKRIQFGARRTVQLSKQIASAAASFEVTQLSAIGVFVLFVHLFVWVTRLFLTNNIKTNKVVRLSFWDFSNRQRSKHSITRWSTPAI